jgi:hypothetical protein
MRSGLDCIEARDNIYDDGFLIKPTGKTDLLVTAISHGNEYLAAAANSKIVLIKLKLTAYRERSQSW